MKKQLKLVLLLLGISFILLPGCEKKSHSTTIKATNLVNLNRKGAPIFTGTFTARGGLNTSGTHLMFVVPEKDPTFIDCTTTMTAPEGTFIILMHCSLTANTGEWHIASGSGTGLYKFIVGSGTLTMMFPPSPSVPPGALGVETMTGKVFPEGIW